MFSPRLIVMLMLVAAVMPVSLTYAHYSKVALFSTGHPVTADNLAAEADMAEGEYADHCHPGKFHLSSCHFHVCADCAMTSTFAFLSPPRAAIYTASIKPRPLSINPPPDTKPPIIAFHSV